MSEQLPDGLQGRAIVHDAQGGIHIIPIRVARMLVSLKRAFVMNYTPFRVQLKPVADQPKADVNRHLDAADSKTSSTGGFWGFFGTCAAVAGLGAAVYFSPKPLDVTKDKHV